MGGGRRTRWVPLPAGLALGGVMFLSAQRGAAERAPGAATDAAPSFAAVRLVIAQRCQPCHSQYQTDRTMGPAPAGVTFDTPESIARPAERHRPRAGETRTMPPAHQTRMNDDEPAPPRPRIA